MNDFIKDYKVAGRGRVKVLLIVLLMLVWQENGLGAAFGLKASPNQTSLSCAA